MDSQKWLQDLTPLPVLTPEGVRVVAYVSAERRLVRWVISNPRQRLRKYDAIAKDCIAWERVIKPHADLVEVLDKVVGTVYCISVADFEQHKWLLATASGGQQWAVDRKWWGQRTVRGEVEQ